MLDPDAVDIVERDDVALAIDRCSQRVVPDARRSRIELDDGAGGGREGHDLLLLGRDRLAGLDAASLSGVAPGHVWDK